MTAISRLVRSRRTILCVLAAVLLLTRPVGAAITLSGFGSSAFASTAGGTVFVFTPNGTFAGLTATLDGVPVELFSFTSGPLRILVAPPHAPGPATLVVTDTSNATNTGTATITYVALQQVGARTAVQRVALTPTASRASFSRARAAEPVATATAIHRVLQRHRVGLRRADGWHAVLSQGSSTWLSLNTPCFDCFATSSLDGSRFALRAFGPGTSTGLVIDAPFTSGPVVFASSVASQPWISGNGQFVAFTSIANLDSDPGDTSGADLFVRDLAGGITERWTTSQNVSGDASISADGRYVVFVTAGSLLAADANAGADVYWSIAWRRPVRTSAS